jgi:hypothetical protein
MRNKRIHYLKRKNPLYDIGEEKALDPTGPSLILYVSALCGKKEDTTALTIIDLETQKVGQT